MEPHGPQATAMAARAAAGAAAGTQNAARTTERPSPLPQSGQEEGSLSCSKAMSDPTRFSLAFHCCPAGGKLGREHPRHTHFVFPSTTCFSIGSVAILPLTGKPHGALSSGSVLVCPVVNTLLWVKHSLNYIPLLTLLWLLQFSSKL